MNLILESTDDDGVQTLGQLFVVNDANEIQFTCRTLELSWKDNKKRVSCIPEGTYKVMKHKSPKFGACFWLKDVPNRSGILIHPGNFHTQILGCILVGDDLAYVNKDSRLDVINSSLTLKKLLKLMPNSFEIKIFRTNEKQNSQ